MLAKYKDFDQNEFRVLCTIWLLQINYFIILYTRSSSHLVPSMSLFVRVNRKFVSFLETHLKCHLNDCLIGKLRFGQAAKCRCHVEDEIRFDHKIGAKAPCIASRISQPFAFDSSKFSIVYAFTG